jgi:hypothetical protein
MLAGLIYAARLAACFIVVSVGAILAFGSAFAKTSPTPGIIVGGLIVAGGVFAWPRRPNAWRHDKPTERQIAYARDLGIPIPRGITKGELSDLISDFKNAF